MATAKIIICTYGFPPYLRSLGGAIRVLKLAEFLTQKGEDVTVVCARTPHFDTFGYDEALAKINTITCEDPIANVARRTVTSAKDAAANSQKRSDPPNIQSRLRQRLKHVVLDAMIPDTGFLVSRKMRKAVLQEIESAKGPVALITSGPPHSIHLIGKHIKRTKNQVRWIMDYRDSWNGTSLFRKKNPFFQSINQSMERSCLKAADHLTYISGPMLPKAEQIANIQLSDKATLISNGFDEKLLDNITRTNKALNGRQMKLGYFGAVDHGEQSYRDPATVFKTLEKLPENKVQFVIHGPSKLEAGWEQRLGSRLMNGGKLTHLEAIQRMFEMDALVLLHTREEGADEVITGKVFEYISTGLPIISIGPKSMAVNQLLRDDPTFFSVDHRDEAHLLATIEKLHGQSLGGPVRRAESIIKAFSRTTQHEKFIQLLKVKEGNCE